jgi:3-deoxy-7-phosphoheptulonate synthase
LDAHIEEGTPAMIIVLKPGATDDEVRHILDEIERLGLTPHVSKGEERTIIGVIGQEDVIRTLPVEAYPGVENVIPILKPFKLVGREFKPRDSVVRVRDVAVGGGTFTIAAGPCAVESRELTLRIAETVHALGAKIMRGGAFKPRTSPYSFQGLGEEGLKYLAEARERTGMPIVTELMDPRHVPLFDRYADMVQIGARNMANFTLLKEVGKMRKPVLLKRGMMSTIKEFLLSAEYICSEGNMDVVLCERGIRTFETETRNTLDISAVPVIKQLSHLPVFVDPSHAAGRDDIVESLSLAAVAAGADGLIVEVHPEPEHAKSDGEQALVPEQFAEMVRKIRAVAQAVGKTL